MVSCGIMTGETMLELLWVLLRFPSHRFSPSGLSHAPEITRARKSILNIFNREIVQQEICDLRQRKFGLAFMSRLCNECLSALALRKPLGKGFAALPGSTPHLQLIPGSHNQDTVIWMKYLSLECVAVTLVLYHPQ